MSCETVLDELATVAAEGWAGIRDGPYWAHVIANGVDRRLYVATMVELYHYTRHNSINQAFATWRVAPEDSELLSYCYRHADDELGHERMILNDLESFGVPADEAVSGDPMPATQALMGYLYGVGLHQGAVARLGYSYWAESSYEHIGELVGHAQSDLDLAPQQMTFFLAHQDLDTTHAEEVRRMISRFVRTDEEHRQVKGVARTTLYLTGQILDNVIRAYCAAESSERDQRRPDGPVHVPCRSL
ncbi:MAG: iron-containing redox enzyme family protein [Acidimicrobiales bacterium]